MTDWHKHYMNYRSEASLEKARKRANDYYRKNRESVLTKLRATSSSEKTKQYSKAYIQKWKAKVFERLGRKCVRCGFDDMRALQLDHIHGGGTNGNNRMTRGRGFYYRLLALSTDLEKEIQVLCANCNWIKRSENKEANQFIEV